MTSVHENVLTGHLIKIIILVESSNLRFTVVVYYKFKCSIGCWFCQCIYHSFNIKLVANIPCVLLKIYYTTVLLAQQHLYVNTKNIYPGFMDLNYRARKVIYTEYIMEYNILCIYIYISFETSKKSNNR